MIDIPKKLQIKAGMRILVARPPREFVLGPLPDDVEVTDSGKGPFDLALAFVGSRLDIEQVAPEATRKLREGGILWMCYPKKSSGVETDVTRDYGWDALSEDGWFPVTQVAVDEVWSALRFKLDPALGKARAKRAAAPKKAAPKKAAPKKAAPKKAAPKKAAPKKAAPKKAAPKKALRK